MIHAQIRRQGSQISGFCLSGHAGSGAYGQDIVCAAVSVLAINTVNSLEKLALVKPKVEIDEVDGGYLSLELDAQDLADLKAQLLLQSFVLGLNDIERSYQEFIQIKD